MEYPSKKEHLGTWLYCHQDKATKEIARYRLKNYYKEMKYKYERTGNVIWCVFEEPKFIEKPSSSNDRLNSIDSIGIKWEVSGRAFYIKRTFNKSILKKKKHGFTKNIPKKKRGLYVLGKGKNG